MIDYTPMSTCKSAAYNSTTVAHIRKGSTRNFAARFIPDRIFEYTTSHRRTATDLDIASDRFTRKIIGSAIQRQHQIFVRPIFAALCRRLAVAANGDDGCCRRPILLRQHRSPSAGGLRKGADGEQRDHHAQRKNKAENAFFHKSTSSFSEILSFCYQYNTF